MTTAESLCGKTSCWRARRIRKSRRSGRRLKPGPARTSYDWRRIRRSCCSTGAMRISGATKTGIGKESLDGHTWGARYAHELFPKIVTELDPTRPYSANSPYSPGANGERIHPNDPDHGTHHQWEVWNRIDYTAYRSEIPRFCSEFGFQAPPARRTLSDWVHAVDGSPLESASDPKNDAISFSTKRPMTATASSTVAWPRTL
jgi:hypothetical protein